MATVHILGIKNLSTSIVEDILKDQISIKLSKDSRNAIQSCRSFLEEKLRTSSRPYYGINTGFGSLCNQEISKVDLEKLQENLVLSHACGMGNEIPDELVRLILFLKIKNLSFGYSGVRVSLVEQLIALYNHKILPVIFEMGSLGASGDLAPLAHLSLALLSEGNVQYKGKKMSASQALKKVKLAPFRLQAKEGLALLNGTQFSLAYGLWSVYHAERLYKIACMITAISMDAYYCDYSPLDANIHRIRKQKGQIKTAQRLRKLLKGSEIGKMKKDTVQDPYSFRCTPQVLGASLDAIEYAKQVFETELNAVTDNPNIFPEQNKILTGGNFHAQPIAYALDFLSIAVAEIGSISERRSYKLINGDRGLPSFLISDAGLNSGFMISQYTAASIASQNKQLCTPCSVDTIPSSKGQEDHVSMAANSGTKCKRVVDNVYRLLGIELLLATQALSFRRPKKTSPELEKVVRSFRRQVKPMKTDRLLHDDMIKAEEFLKKLSLD